MEPDKLKEQTNKMIAWMKSEEGQEDIRNYFQETENKEKIRNSQLERFHKLFSNRFVEILEKITKKYESEQYIKRWIGRGIEPEKELYWFLYDYAIKYGREGTEEELEAYGNMFVSTVYYLKGYYFMMMIGQGSVIKIEKEIPNKLTCKKPEVIDGKIKIENKPIYCSAWVSQLSSKVMCNSIPCCGYFLHGKTNKVTPGFNTEQIGRHPLVDGRFQFKDGTFHDPNFVREHILVNQTKFTYNGYTYFFSNENLKKGDEVYTISNGYIEDGKYYHIEFNFESFVSEYPNDPHIILDLNHSHYKPYETRTNKGFSPKECYFKIVDKTTL